VKSPSQRTLRGSGAAEDTAPSDPELAVPPDYPFLAAPKGPDELGRLGAYRILKVLGTGAMGVVFQAEDPHLKRLVALKVLRPALAASAEFHRRFLREAQLAAAIDHEHIVTIYQVGEDRGVPFLAMKLLEGESLEDRLKNGGRLPLSEVLRVGREVAEGLSAAHAKGLVHRDIKPANIWLETGRDRVKIVDFGLARGTGQDAHFTQAGAVIGTPAYMAPEQANGEEVDARCDLFSLGVVLYRISTGQLPFPGKDTLSVLKALATLTPEPPHKIVSSVPRAFSNLVMRLLAKDPDERFQSGQEVAEAIAALERGETVAEVPAPNKSPEKKGREKEKATASPAPATESGAKKKGAKKARSRTIQKQVQSETKQDWGIIILVGALVLLGLAVLVILLATIRQLTRPRAAAQQSEQVCIVLVQPSEHQRGRQSHRLAHTEGESPPTISAQPSSTLD
jgi:serine/threonine protein kinase